MGKHSCACEKMLRRMFTVLAFFGVCYIVFIIVSIMSTSTQRLSAFYSRKAIPVLAVSGFLPVTKYQHVVSSFHARRASNNVHSNRERYQEPDVIKDRTQKNVATNQTEFNVTRKQSDSITTNRAESNATRTPDHSIGIYFKGRLGNLMFQYASLYGIAKKNGLQPIIPSNTAIDKLFSLNSVRISTGYGKKFDKKYMELKGCTFEPPAMELGPGRDVFLDGYFQSWKYFKHVEDDLRKQFTFKESVMSKARDQIRQLTQNANMSEFVLVGVHVRRGDMAHKKVFIDYGYISADEQYLRQAMEHFKKKYTKLKFLIVSDEIDWCRRTIKQSYNEDILFVDSKNSPEVDMAILRSCNHTVMTVGSFGWWAAWLAGGDVIYYKGYPRPGSKLFNLVNQTDYRYPNWIGM